MIYRMADCVWNNVDRWHVSEPALPDGSTPFTWSFTRCQPFRSSPPLSCRVTDQGTQTDVTFASFDIPIISRRAADALSTLLTDSVELIPVSIAGYGHDFFILNLLCHSAPLDERRSDILWWTEQDKRPDKLGQYRMVTKAVARPEVALPPLSRVRRFEVMVAATEETRSAFLEEGLTGVSFEPIRELNKTSLTS